MAKESKIGTPMDLSPEEMELMRQKVAENPHILAYAHHIGSALIKPEDKGRIRGVAMQSMYDQTNSQLTQIQEQVELLARQAKAIKDRMTFSERIYQIDMGFQPIVGKIYHLYQGKDGTDALSIIGPNEWGRSFPHEKHLATLKLLADHTWDVLEQTNE